MEDSQPFRAFHFDKRLVDILLRRGYRQPSAIQAAFWRSNLAKADIIAQAPTGSGKTLAYLLPILQKCLLHRKLDEARVVRALIILPTRELATQTATVCRDFARQLEVKCVLACGANPLEEQQKKLRSGAEILIGTPGRLAHIVTQDAGILDYVHSFVLDEADSLLSENFLEAINEIAHHLPSSRQTILCSATFNPQIEALSKRYQKRPTRLNLSDDTITSRRVKQRVIFLESDEKARLLLKTLKYASGRTIVFVRTKMGVVRLSQFLRTNGIRFSELHGDRTSGERSQAMSAFRRGDVPILVTTDLASRGIDVTDVTHVINYDLPCDVKTYIHRIGRTARAGKRGEALTLCGQDDRKLFREIEKNIGYRIPSAVP